MMLRQLINPFKFSNYTSRITTLSNRLTEESYYHDTSCRPYSKASGSKDSELKNLIRAKIPVWAETIKTVRKKYDQEQISEITVSQIYSGMHGVRGLVWETSDLCPRKGVTFRGLNIDEIRFILPKLEGAKEPMIEGFLWFLLTGEIPTLDQAQMLACELVERAKKFPKPILKFLDCFDKCWHPMTSFSMIMNALSNHSKFREAYMKGLPKNKYWELMYEDGMDLIAFAPLVGGLIYRKKYMNSKYKWSNHGDLATNFANLLEKSDDKLFIDYMRLYMILHSDHDGGNVSAHTMHIVSSALADPFKSYAAATSTFASPLHGLGSQISLQWLQALQAKHGENPTPECITEFVEETLKSGKGVPGYGHKVLQKADPRFLAQLSFAKKHKIEDPLIKLVENVYKIVPPILVQANVENPCPTTNAISGSLLQHFCIDDVDFYSVFFGIGRSLGLVSSNIWSRAMHHPVERLNSTSTCKLRRLLGESDQNKTKTKCFSFLQ